jgi:AraC-like DNA-binding protein
MSAGDYRPTIRIGQVDQLLLGARRHGLNADALMVQAGIAPALLTSPLAKVTQQQYARLTRLLRHRLRDELWGLCPQPLPPGSYAQSLQLMVRCATLGEALSLTLRHYRLLLRDITPRLQHGDDAVVVSFTPHSPPDEAVEYALRTLAFVGYGTACWLVGRRLPLLQANTPHRRLEPAHASRLFQAPVSMLPGWTGWYFEPRFLALPVARTPVDAQALLRRAPVGLLVRYRDPHSTVERVRALLRRNLAEAPPSLAQVGAELGMTAQTLRRHLVREGQGFRALRAALRRDAAIEYLARPQLSLAEIARRLGFSELSTFHRAFRHWTGLAPGRYRLKQRHDA